jgi:hypothetical protein
MAFDRTTRHRVGVKFDSYRLRWQIAGIYLQFEGVLAVISFAAQLAESYIGPRFCNCGLPLKQPLGGSAILLRAFSVF